MNARALGAGLLAALTLGSLVSPAPADEPEKSPRVEAARPVSIADVAAGEAAYLVIHRVLLSPRCMNCHPSGDAPLHGDVAVPHSMNVSRKSVEAGLVCTTCHRSKNGAVPHSPPGVTPEWRMPTRDQPMVFQGKSPHDLCEQLKDPARNGGKSLSELAEHMGHDPLVLWAWAPGPGRSVPPIPHAELARAAETWTHAGAPCPK